MTYESQIAETVHLRGHKGDRIDAYTARPFGAGPHSGVAAKPGEQTPPPPVAPIAFTKDLQCPLLGFFGIEDTRPAPADAGRTEEALRKFGKACEFHAHENAGHAFFSVDRPQYRVHAAVDGWKKVFAWLEKCLH